MSSSEPAQSSALVICLMMVLSTFFTVPAVSGSSSRDPATFIWNPILQLTSDKGGDHVGQTGIDGDGNLHCVWVNYTGGIFYGKTDPNGTFLVPPKVLGTSNRGWDANPRLSIDPSDNIHISWSNNTVSGLDRIFEYVRLNVGGSVTFINHGAGGDAIIGDTTGFSALRFFNASGPSVPAYGPLCLLFFDNSGSLVKNLTVGYHKRHYEQASMTRNSTGSTFVVYALNETVMNLTSVQGTTLGLDQKNLLTGRATLTSLQLSIDSEGDLQLLWIDWIPNVLYTDSGIYHMRLYPNGTLLRDATFISGVEGKEYRPTQLALLDTKGYGDLPVISRGSYSGMGSGGDEMEDVYLFVELRNNGSVKNFTKYFMHYCSKNTPAMAQSAHGNFFMFWGERMCWRESGGGTTKIDEDLHFRRSRDNISVDLAVKVPDVTFPDRTFPDEDFTLNVTVRNFGLWASKDFKLNVTDKANAKLLGTGTSILAPATNTTFSFTLTLHKKTTIMVYVDPLTNIEADMSNNLIELNITPVARPDLAILTDNITFSNVRPNKGQSLEVSAIISNLGGLDAGAEVLFFDGVNGTRIGKTAVQFNSSSTITSIFWAPSKVGVRTVVIRITNVTPYELPGHSGNNEANRTLLVGSPTIPSVQIVSPAEDRTIELGFFNITGIAWDNDNDDLQVFVRVNSGPWEQAATILNASIKGVNWFIQWDFTDLPEGNHTIGAQVKDDLHQNETLHNIRVVKYLVPFKVLGWSPLKDPTINETQSQIFEVFVNNIHNLNIAYVWTLDGEDLNKTSRLNITTTYDAAGTYNVFVKVSYGNLIWDHSWKLTVMDVNRPPVLTSHSPQNSTQLIKHQTTMTFEIFASDPDGDMLNYTWTTGGKVVNISKGKATVKFDKEGNFPVNVTISDGKGGSVNFSWLIHVKPEPTDCCMPGPGPHTNTFLEDMFLVAILVIGGIIIVLLAVIYIRYGRLSKGKKGKGETGVGESPMEDELTPAGHIR